MNFEILTQKFYKAKAKHDMLQETIEKQENILQQEKNRAIAIEQAQVLIQQVAQETQNVLVYQINDIVNTALQTCFPDEYEFKVEFEVKRNKTEAKLMFYKNGQEIDPLSASGGGVVDVAAFGLRIATWTLSTSRNVMIIDEGFRFLSRDLQPRMAEILSEISKKLNLQFISVTHSPDLIAQSDKIFEVTLQKGVSTVKEM